MAEVWNVAMTTETTLLDPLLILLHSSNPHIFAQLSYLGMLSRMIRRACIKLRRCFMGSDSGFFQVHENEHRSFPPAR